MKKIRIKDIGSTLTGFAFNSQKFNEEKGFPIVRIRDLRHGKTKTLFDGEFDGKYLIKKGDLLIGMDGEFNLIEWDSEDALLNQRVCKLIIDDSKAHKSYIKYALPKKLKDIEDVTPFVTVKHLSNKQVLEIEIPLPDLKNQQEIAHVLEQADKARQQRKAANALTDQFLQSSFLSLFGDPVKNEKGWEAKRLEELYSTKKDGTKCGPFGSALKKGEYVKRGIPVWVMDNIQEGKFIEEGCLYVSEEKYDELKSYSTENGDIIISRAGTVGKMCTVSSNYSRSIISTNLIRLSLNQEKLLPIVFVSLMTYFGPRVGKLRTGTDGAFTHMNTGVLNNLSIPLPPLSLQQQFAAIVAQAETLRKKQQENELELEQLFQALLQKYFG